MENFPRATAHRYIRAITRYYASRRFAPQFSDLMGLLLAPPNPLWMVSEPCGLAPSLALNLAHPHQRKIYYFPKAWGKYWMTEPFPEFLRQTLHPGAMFIDIGAHLGFFSFHAARLLGPEGKVLSFEPDPDCYASLSRSAALNGPATISCVNIALSNANGEALFYRAKKPASSSLVPEKQGHAERYRDTITVPCRTFDDCMKTYKEDLNRLQLIKCDVEGHEVAVVSGMGETLAAASFPMLWVEVRGPAGSTRAPNTYPEVCRILGEWGYRPFLWTNGDYVPVPTDGISGRTDVVFCHESRKD
ncbi:MAG: FkbM family methyltransferase [candidate division Zixibacteria bacterium]|nr:FkbM family methyltransferase [candidate division Zixibacteria bacterium]